METSNHKVILGDQPRKIVVGADGKVESEFKKEFEIAGKDSGASAVIWICVKGLVGDAEPVSVSINGKGVGRLMPNKNADADSWSTQMLNFSASEGSLLPSLTSDSTENVIQIPAEGSEAKSGTFYVQNIVVLYKAIFD